MLETVEEANHIMLEIKW